MTEQSNYTVQHFWSAIDGFAPFSLAESYDNPGLLIGSRDTPVSRAMLALDATADVIDEAKNNGIQLLITHHPVIFRSVSSIAGDSLVYKMIQAGLSVICAHTNLDIASGGVSDALADSLKLSESDILSLTSEVPMRKVVTFVPRDAVERVYSAMVRAGAGMQGNYAGAAFFGPGEGRFLPLAGARPTIGEIGRLEQVEETRLELLVQPGELPGVLDALRASHPYEEPAFDVLETFAFTRREGLGRIGSTDHSYSPDEFAHFVKERLGVGGVKYVPGKDVITKVAVCGGSGTEYLALAHASGAQAMVSADSKYHDLLEAKRLGITLVDAGHYATEAVVLPVLLDKLQAELPGADIRLAERCADPAMYL